MQIGDSLEDLTLKFSDGTIRTLSECWVQAPTVLVFLRHFG